MFRCWWSSLLQFARTTHGAFMLALAGAVLIYFVVWHTAHTLTVLPFGLLFLCPLLHVFMHRGHGGHGQGHSHE